MKETAWALAFWAGPQAAASAAGCCGTIHAAFFIRFLSSCGGPHGPAIVPAPFLFSLPPVWALKPYRGIKPINIPPGWDSVPGYLIKGLSLLPLLCFPGLLALAFQSTSLDSSRKPGCNNKTGASWLAGVVGEFASYLYAVCSLCWLASLSLTSQKPWDSCRFICTVHLSGCSHMWPPRS